MSEQTEIPAKLVMQLRKATGMPMMKCKKALADAELDFEKAVDILRKEGMKSAEKKADRATSEGLVGLILNDNGREGTLVQVVCETEPVKNTPMFQEFVQTVTQLAADKKPADLAALKALAWDGEEDNVADALKTIVAKIGENMQVAGYRHYAVDEGAVGAYVHHDRKTASMVSLKGAGDLAEFAKDLCMHVVFAKPKVLAREELDAAEADKEEAFLREQIADDPKMAGKPEQALTGIIKGRMEKNYYGERVLNEQPWYRDNAKKVSDFLKEKGATIEHFVFFGA